MLSKKSLLYFQLVLSMFLWGGTWIAGRVLVHTFSPMPAAFLRFFLASLFLLLMCRTIQGSFPSIKRQQVLPLLFLGGTGIFLYSWFFFTGLQTTPAGRAALIVACIPACIAAASALLYKERFSKLRVFSTLLALAGVAVVIGDGNPLALLTGGIKAGDLYILGCVVSWTAYSLGGRSVMRSINPLCAVTWSCVFGSLLVLPPALASGMAEEILEARFIDWFCVAYLGVLATGLAYLWYYRAIQSLGPSRAGIFINLVPVFALALSAMLLGEEVHLSLLAGGAMVITGVYLTNRA
ncbi:MAG: DMT family transporter [Desulfovibrio sp.]|nr:MAG: DMT family transporter [Desulfovibrio sp.]